MKKILTFAVAAIAAGAVQAASLNWGGGIANNYLADQMGGLQGDGSDAVSAGSVLALFLLSDVATIDDIDSYNYDNKTVNFKDGVTTTAELMQEHTITTDEAANYDASDVFVREDADGGVNGTWLVMIYDSSTKNYAFVQGISTVTGVTDTGSAGDIGTYDYTFTTVDAVGNVPEPTTVALLALGLAAVGLKRKVA